MTTTEAELGTRILVLPPTRKDGEVTRNLLEKADMVCITCSGPTELAQEVRRGAGGVLFTEMVVAATGFDQVLSALDEQEPWSDLPIVMMLHGGALSPKVSDILSKLTNVTLLERPSPTRSIVSALQAALRARRRQYQIQGLLKSEKAARQDGERANRIKDEFLATLSHELRTPLNSIFGWAQILKFNPADTSRVVEAVEVIDRNVRVQIQLIEDLLDISRIISGKIRLDVQQVQLSDVISAAIDAVAPAIRAKEIQLKQVIDPSVGPISGDAGRLQQVLWNLIANAVKFTPQNGHVYVFCERVDANVEVSVTDTGEGIEPEFLPHLFERFTQADGSITRRHGGLGLGLSIVKNLTELHGGSVDARSPGPGKGSTFRVRIPQRMMAGTQEPIAQEKPSVESRSVKIDRQKLRGVKVLIIDNECDARELLEFFLGESDAVVASADSASEADRLLAAFQPDVIVSDIGMPDEDGYEFIRRIRNGGIKTPAIALTAFARAEDRVRSLRSGYQAHLTKPVEPAELLAMISRLHES